MNTLELKAKCKLGHYCSLQLFHFSVRELLPSHKKFLEFFNHSLHLVLILLIMQKVGFCHQEHTAAAPHTSHAFKDGLEGQLTNALCKQENASTLQKARKNNTIFKIKTSSCCCLLISWAQQDYEFICISNSEKQSKHFLSITNPIPTSSLQSPKLILLWGLTHFPKNIEVFPDAQNFYSHAVYAA